VLGKKLIYTAHNVNIGERDNNDSWLNRFTLRFHYAMMDHIFVHNVKMKEQLLREFCINEQKVTVIPYGINNVVPRTQMTALEAKSQLSLKNDKQVILFFGNIAPYKGLDILIMAMTHLKNKGHLPLLLIAGRVKDPNSNSYWKEINSAIEANRLNDNILKQIEYIHDDEIELYFKAADVLILPYRHIFQSGVLFLAYSFGLPVIAANVGSLKSEIIEGTTGLICRPDNPEDLANTISQYFDNALYKNLIVNREKIIAYANKHNSWKKVGIITRNIYNSLQ
jgi:D-inositol-3-phosphate glycosyltransferase